ncbi:MAG: glycoside hydrolase family 11 protein [Oscillospiraceae bacterium]|nr:glycoside hydrolase family 11 protein [Oscillospiraceae bacterium]
MKRVLSVVLAMVTAVTIIPFTQVGAIVLTGNKTNGSNERINGFDYESWTDDRGSEGFKMEINNDGTFVGTWNNTYNTLFRVGRRFGNTTTVAGAGDISLAYSATEFTSNRGATYLTVYGWTRNPLIEWYIVDKWLEYCPMSRFTGTPAVGTTSGDYTYQGTVEANGGVYDIVTAWRDNQPSIDGSRTFLQIFSIRRNSRGSVNQPNATQGVIDVSAHFAAWDKIPAQTFKGVTSKFDSSTASLYEVSMLFEGFGGDTRSSGKGSMERLCIKYGTNRICTQNGCSHCDGTIAPPVCGENGYVCGNCALCKPAPAECKCDADKQPKTQVYKAEFTQAVIDEINSAGASNGIQRAGSPTITLTPDGIRVGGRTDSWNSIDVMLGGITSPDKQYQMIVSGVGVTNQLQLTFPLDDDPWDSGIVTGKEGEVSTKFNGITPDGQGDFRIRIRTNGTDDFNVNSITVIEFGCCGTCATECTCDDEDIPPPPPGEVIVSREKVTLVCDHEGCGVEGVWIVTTVTDDGAVVGEWKAATKKVNGGCGHAGGSMFYEIPPFDENSSIVEW